METSIDYLIIGHLSYDLTPSGVRVGGTVSYAAATASAFRKAVGVVTSWGKETELDIGMLNTIPSHYHISPRSTTFQNIHTSNGRKQILFHKANPINIADVPPSWRSTPIIHLAPIVDEIPPEMTTSFSPKFLGITPQGWFRSWNSEGLVFPLDWNEFIKSNHFSQLAYADAVIISDEDVGFSQTKIDDLANQCRLLVVTQGAKGATLYWQGKNYHYPAPKVTEIDPVGAGDVFASTFFIQMFDSHDIHRSAKIAVKIAAYSVTRAGQLSAPTQEEIKNVFEDV